MKTTVALSTADVTGTAPNHVGRDRLLTRLDAIPHGGTGLLIAPAGSGKSVLLGQWLANQPETTACSLILTTSHNNAASLTVAMLDSLAEALGPSRQIKPNRMPMITADGEWLSADFVGQALRALRSSSKQVVLIFEDAHVMQQLGLITALGELAERLPQQARLLISSRWNFPFPSRSMRLSGRVTELRESDLAFDTDEASEMLERISGRPLEPELVKTLVARTDGWAAGLQLAGISLQKSPDPEAFVAEFAGTDRLVVEYLTNEVLDSLDAPTREFLSCTAILPWLTPEICDAVTGHFDGYQKLNALVDRSLFLVPLDQQNHRYRYHHLFADLLRYEFAAEQDRVEQHRVRIEAADWLLRRGYIREAIDQLLEADELEHALAVILEHGMRFIEQGEAATLVTWLAEMSRRHPDDCPAITINLLAAQIASQRYVSAAETHHLLLRRIDLGSGEKAMASALYSSLGVDELPPDETFRFAADALVGLARIAEEEVPDILGTGGYASAKVIAGCMAAYAHFRAGRVSTAGKMFRWVSGMSGMQYAVWRVQTLSALALVEAWSGHLGQAEQRARHALDVADAAGVRRHPSTTPAYLALAVVAIAHCESSGAQDCLDQSRAWNDGPRFFAGLQTLLQLQLLALTEEPHKTLRRLHESIDMTIDCPLVVDAATTLESRLLVEIGAIKPARALLGNASTRSSLVPVWIDVALLVGDLTGATRELDCWDFDSSQPIQVVEHGLASSAVALAAGDQRAAREALLDAALAAEIEDIRRPFLDRPELLRLASRSHRPGRVPFLSSLSSIQRPPECRRSGQDRLIEPLTERELVVLELLPTRMSNQQIASTLYVSVNTEKTHVRNIYRKLNVSCRDEAVRHACDLGIL
ncbi:MAG TPA: LuxR C-terminal-related transcriptional regulator [Microthrixaceae bacterium]|nr:LuxR C-terminal-related transcriptional regulator [Microthrixaceae bacterium]